MLTNINVKYVNNINVKYVNNINVKYICEQHKWDTCEICEHVCDK